MGIKIHKGRSELILSFMLFIIIFNPPVMKGISFTMAAIAISVLFFIIKCSYLSKYIFGSNMYRTIWILLLFMIYTIISGFVNAAISPKSGIVLVNVLRSIALNASMILVAMLITFVILKYGYSLDGMIRSYVYCGVMQAIVSILSFLLPWIRNYLNAVMVANVRHENIARLTYNSNGLRCYGFAAHLFDTFGCVMSMLAVMALCVAIAGNKKFYLYFCMISFSAVINSRTSMVLISVGFAAVLYFSLKNQKTVKRILEIFGLLFVVTIMGRILLGHLYTKSSSMNSEWIKSGIDSIRALIFDRTIDRTFRDANTNYFSILIDRFLFLPKDPISLLFGTGLLPGDAIGLGSDVAYIRHIWQFGIIGAVMQYAVYLYAIIRGGKALAKPYNGLIYSLGIMVFVYLIKNEGLGYGMPMLALIPLIFAVWSFNKKSA